MQLTHHHLLFPVYSKKKLKVFELFQNSVFYFFKNTLSIIWGQTMMFKALNFTSIASDEFRGRAGIALQTRKKSPGMNIASVLPGGDQDRISSPAAYCLSPLTRKPAHLQREEDKKQNWERSSVLSQRSVATGPTHLEAHHPGAGLLL